MKKIILISCLSFFSLGMGNSENISTKKTSRWIDPSKEICINSGGIYKNNLCYADFKEGQNICSLLGGKVPSYKDLSKEISLCGGNIEEGEIKNKKFYHSCYRKKGFKGKSYDDETGGLHYMTSEQTEDRTVMIDFFHVYELGTWLDATTIVRCIK